MSESNSEAANPTFTLEVDAGHPAAEVILLDHRLRLIDRGIGLLKTEQPGGVYRAKVVLGRQSEERTILLDGDKTESLSVHEFASPAPLEGTSQTDASHVEAARRESSQVHLRAGEGATFFIFARRWVGESPDQRAEQLLRPAHGLSVWTEDGEQIANLEESAVVDPELDTWAALTISVDPGPYTLRFETTQGGTLEQGLVACRDWQTQAFVLRKPGPYAADPGRSEPMDFVDLAVLMSRSGFGGNQDDMRLAEVARLALTDQRRVMSPDMVSRLLNEKFENPMLGLFGAHLMLTAHERSRKEPRETERPFPNLNEHSELGETFAKVVDNLRRMLDPDHPDVEALSLKLDEPTRQPSQPFTSPPMLRDSWALIVEATNDRPDILDRRVWQRIEQMTASRPFLTWLIRPAQSEAVGAEDPLATTVKAHAAIAAKAPEQEVGDLELVGGFTSFDLDMGAGGPLGAMMPQADTSADADEETRRQVSVKMGVPRFAVDDALSS